MSVKPLDQPAQAPEKKLDANQGAVDSTLSSVDRVELLKQYKPADPGKTTSDMPSLTLQGWQDFKASKPADQLTTGVDKSQPVSDQQKPAELTKEQRIENAKKAIESPEASIKQKMDAMSTIFKDSEKGKDGRVHITLNDGGKPRKFEIASLEAGKDVHLLQLSSTDAQGKSHPVLRGVERNGEIEQQRKKNGSKADYRGDWWTANEKDSTISKFSQSDAVLPNPAVKPKTDVLPTPEVTPKKDLQPQQEVKPRLDVKPDNSTVLPENVPLPRRRPDAEETEKQQQTEKKPKEPVIIPWRNREGDSQTETRPDGRSDVSPGAVRSVSDIAKFYTRQDDGYSCAAFAVGMAKADHRLGRPIVHGRESQDLKDLTKTNGIGYRGTLETLAGQMRQIGLEAKPYSYGFGNVGEQAMRDLNRELDKGHSAVAKVINPHTGNPHYIYIAGRDANGKYILGDPDRKNTQHFKPVSQQYLQRMMGPRDGFVATW
jgi:hypothetical protein